MVRDRRGATGAGGARVLKVRVPRVLGMLRAPGVVGEGNVTKATLAWAGMVAVLAGGLATGGGVRAQAPAAQAASTPERTVWYFYKVKWGFQDEFVALFKRNHYPVLKEEMKSGRIKDVRTFVPTYHGDGRADWTFAVALTYRDVAAMTGPSGDAEIVKR